METKTWKKKRIIMGLILILVILACALVVIFHKGKDEKEPKVDNTIYITDELVLESGSAVPEVENFATKKGFLSEEAIIKYKNEDDSLENRDLKNMTIYLDNEDNEVSKDTATNEDGTLKESYSVQNIVIGIGTYQVEITDKDKTYTSKLIVEDTTTPTITLKESVEIVDGNEIKINAFINGVCKDNSREECILEYVKETKNEEEVIYEQLDDIDKSVGTREIIIRAKDYSNNEVVVKSKLTVKAKPATSSNSSSSSSKTTTVKDGIVGKTTKGYNIEVKNGVYYVKGIMIVNKTYPLPKNFTPINPHKKPTSTTSKCNTCLDKEAYNAWLTMQTAAASDGISLSIVSGFRPYGLQQNLYNNYVKRDGKAAADRYSARPGYSEHQSGLAFDLNQISDNFGNTAAGKWLAKNCYKYGYILRYPKGKESLTGYMYESWHFRYIGDEAVNLYNNGNWITLEEYLGITSKY